MYGTAAVFFTLLREDITVLNESCVTSIAAVTPIV